MIIRVIRNAVVICALFGFVISLDAAQQEQAKKSSVTRSNSPSGTELFKRHCAVCHGNDLKGVGPVPDDLARAWPRSNAHVGNGF